MMTMAAASIANPIFAERSPSAWHNTKYMLLMQISSARNNLKKITLSGIQCMTNTEANLLNCDLSSIKMLVLYAKTCFMRDHHSYTLLHLSGMFGIISCHRLYNSPYWCITTIEPAPPPVWRQGMIRMDNYHFSGSFIINLPLSGPSSSMGLREDVTSFRASWVYNLSETESSSSSSLSSSSLSSSSSSSSSSSLSSYIFTLSFLFLLLSFLHCTALRMYDSAL